MPDDSVDNCITVYHAGGSKPEYYFGNERQIENPSIQVRVRHTNRKDALEWCYQIKDLLDGKSNFFINNNIKYIKEVPYSNLCSDDRLKNKIADWVINDNVVVEFFGMMDKDFYNSKAQNKIMLCKENNINLIYLTEKDLINLYKIFEDFIPN